MDNHGLPDPFEFPADDDSGWTRFKTRFREPAMRISSGRINYHLRQQDGSMQPVSCVDTPDARRYVRWMLFRENQFQWCWSMVSKIAAGIFGGFVLFIAVIAWGLT